MKICKICKIYKRLKDFYAHCRYADGRLNICKKCSKENKYKNIEKIRSQDRKRYLLNKNKILIRTKKYAQSAIGKQKQYLSRKKWIEKNKEKRIAHTIISNLIRDKKIKRLACEICGNKKADAHHDDYKKPLDVRWLCRHHHAEYHRLYRENIRLAHDLSKKEIQK